MNAMDNWTSEEVRDSQAQGWQLTYSTYKGNNAVIVERVYGGKFQSDAEALSYVMYSAVLGNKIAFRAVEYMAAANNMAYIQARKDLGLPAL